MLLPLEAPPGEMLLRQVIQELPRFQAKPKIVVLAGRSQQVRVLRAAQAWPMAQQWGVQG